LRWGGGDGKPTGRLSLVRARAPPVEGQHVRDRFADLLVGQGDIPGREPAGVERSAKLDGPVLVEVVEQPGVNPGPVVDRHDESLRVLPRLYHMTRATGLTVCRATRLVRGWPGPAS